MSVVAKKVVSEEGIIERFRDSAWRKVVEIIIKNKWVVDSATDLREAYYYVRGLAGKMGLEDVYRKLQSESGYNYFSQDLLDRLEAWGIIKSKPPAKPVGFYIKEGVLKFIAEIIHEEIDKYKGIIFVEKESVAKKLSPLSELGYIIMAGQGFPTRLMREVAKQGKLFVLHDADKSGNDIYRVFAEGAKRLKRISEDYALRWVVKHAKNIGLFYDDAVKLGLDPEPEAEKHMKKGYNKRYELQSLVKLQIQHNIENPYVAYAAFKLEQLGEDLRPRILDPVEMYSRRVAIAISIAITSHLSKIVHKHAEEIIKIVQLAGQPVLDGLKLRRDVFEEIAYKSIIELSKIVLSGKVSIQISDYDLTVIIGGISDAVDPDDFLQKFKEKYGVNVIRELLLRS